MHQERTIDQEIIFDSPIFRVERLAVELEDGHATRRDVVYHNGGVCIAAIEDDMVYVVTQYRIAVERETMELPAGKLELGEDPRLAALRELREETGLTPGELIDLGACLPSPGYTSEVLHLYLALDLKIGEMDLDPGEHLTAFKLPLNEVMARVMSGEIQDAKTIICLFKAREYLRSRASEA